jgi:antitoxin (DNA-binding transcriptional repressor) of toxin-antitoxin stability system
MNDISTNRAIILKTMSITELRASLSHLERLLKKTGEINVTRRGRLIAKLAPARGMPSLAKFRASMPRMKVPSEVLISEDRDGR